MPACLRALGTARAGAVVNFEGFCAASPQPRILAMGVRLCAFRAASETSTRAAAPSDRGEALAAVTVPSLGLKTGRSWGVLDSLNWTGVISEQSHGQCWATGSESRMVKEGVYWRLLTFLGSSSLSTMVEGFPRAPGISTGTISSLNQPASWAAFAFL